MSDTNEPAGDQAEREAADYVAAMESLRTRLYPDQVIAAAMSHAEDPVAVWRRANPALYPGEPAPDYDLGDMRRRELTVGELVAELLKLPQDAKILRDDSEYGEETIDGVEVRPAVTYSTPNGPAHFPERIVIS